MITYIDCAVFKGYQVDMKLPSDGLWRSGARLYATIEEAKNAMRESRVFQSDQGEPGCEFRIMKVATTRKQVKL